MARGRLKAQWDIAAQILTRIENAWMRDPKKSQPCQPWDVHPFRERCDYQKPNFNVHNLKALLDGYKQSSHKSG